MVISQQMLSLPYQAINKSLNRAGMTCSAGKLLKRFIYYHAQNKAGLYLTEKECIVPMLEVAASLGEIEANVLLADIYLEEGNVHSAKEYLQFAHSKGRPSATFKLGGICETEGKYDLALSHYNGMKECLVTAICLKQFTTH